MVQTVVKPGFRPLCRLSRALALCCFALLSGCLPQSEDEGSASKRSAFAFGSEGGEGSVNSSGKADALLSKVAAVPAEIVERAIGGRFEKETRAAEPSPDTTASAAVAVDPRAPAPLEDTPATVALASFFRALRSAEGNSAAGAITILHLGDSHIAADRFSGDMREEFQSRFGSAGRGMVMPGIFLARGVKFEQGGKWQSALSTGTAPGSYGITGVKVSAGAREDWLRLTATDRPFNWTEVTFQTGPDQGTALIGLDGDMKLISANAPSPSWKTIRLERPARELVIRPKGDGLVTVHAMAIGEKKAGIRYVNLGLPGATALTPLTWNPGHLSHDLSRLSPDLIIVGYGTEESFEDALSIRDYEAKVTRMLEQLRQGAPKASLMVIGPPDVARLPNFAAGAGRAASDVCRALSPQERAAYAERVRNGDPRLARWHPPLRLDEVRQALRRAAVAQQAFFWDWSKLMGGACGIHAWVHSDPPLAAGDHIHLTEEGSKRSARLLFRELMTAYDAFSRPVAAVQPAVAAPQPAAAAPPVATPPAAKPPVVANPWVSREVSRKPAR